LAIRHGQTGLGAVFNDVMPALSPDGRQIAFSLVGGGFVTTAYVLPFSDSLEAAGQPKALDEGGIPALDPEWLNDSELIVDTGGVQSTLWRLNVSGGTTAQPLVVPGTDVVQPAVQLRTHRLAYVSKTRDANIWTIEMASKTQTAALPPELSLPHYPM
jgi:Tol biopolymer transport system component